MSQIDSKSPRKANIFPMSPLSGMLVMRARIDGSILASSEPSKEARMTSHHRDGPEMLANIIDHSAIDTKPYIATL